MAEADLNIHDTPGLVDVVYRADLDAVNLIWHSEYDEGSAVRDAVLAAARYAGSNNVRGWLADISNSREPLSAADLAWVNSDEFRDTIRNSGLTRFVLVPPRPETGQDTGWLADWEQNTLAAFGAGVQAKILSDAEEIQNFLTRPSEGE